MNGWVDEWMSGRGEDEQEHEESAPSPWPFPPGEGISVRLLFRKCDVGRCVSLLGSRNRG